MAVSAAASSEERPLSKSKKPFAWVVYQWDFWDGMSEEEAAAIDEFDPREHRPAQAPGGGLRDGGFAASRRAVHGHDER